MLVKGGGWQTSFGDALCGSVPTSLAGTSNYWSHLWTHHRLVWYELKLREGALNQAGEAAMVKLKEGLSNMATGTQVNHCICGEQFLSPNLPSDQKERMDRIVTEWIVDEDQCFNAESTPGFIAMMATATNGNYDGCCHKTVQGHVVAMGMEGKEEWFEAEYDSLWNTSAPEEPPVPALAPAASASLPVPALAPAASVSALLGSLVDFMASVAHLQAPVAAQVSRVKSEAQRYLELPAAPMNTDPLEWWGQTRSTSQR